MMMMEAMMVVAVTLVAKRDEFRQKGRWQFVVWFGSSQSSSSGSNHMMLMMMDGLLAGV